MEKISGIIEKRNNVFLFLFYWSRVRFLTETCIFYMYYGQGHGNDNLHRNQVIYRQC